MESRLGSGCCSERSHHKPFVKSLTARDVFESAVKENWQSLSVRDGLSGPFDGKLDGVGTGGRLVECPLLKTVYVV